MAATRACILPGKVLVRSGARWVRGHIDKTHCGTITYIGLSPGDIRGPMMVAVSVRGREIAATPNRVRTGKRWRK